MGAYSPSTNTYYNTNVKVASDTTIVNAGVLNNHRDRVALLWRPNDGGSGVDRLYFVHPPNPAVGAATSYSKASDWSVGGINIKIRNAGEFVRMQNASNATGAIQTIDGCDIDNNNSAKFEIKQADTLPLGYINYNIPVTEDVSRIDGDGESIKWTQTTGRTVYDTANFSLNTVNSGDSTVFEIANVNCSTVIEMELTHASNSVDLFNGGVVFGTGEATSNWKIPKTNDELEGLSEDNGDGPRAFILIHPMSGQFIVNDHVTDPISREYFPEDLIFYGDTVCPLITQQPENILIYKYDGYNNTQGELQCVIFYDRVMQGVGFHFAGVEPNLLNFKNTVEQLVFNTMTTSIMQSMSVTPHSFSKTINGNNIFLYTAGGFTSTGNINAINKYETSTDSSSTLAATLSYSKSFLNGGSNFTDGYFIGGRDGVLGTAGVYYANNDKLAFSTDTVAAVSPMTTTRSQFAGDSNARASSNIYICGGGTGANVGVGTPSADVSKYNMDTNTYAYTINNLTRGGRQLLTGKMTDTHFYCIGGSGLIGGTTYDYIDAFVIANETSTSYPVHSMMSVSSTLNSAFYNKSQNSILMSGTAFQFGSAQPADVIFRSYEKFDCNTNGITHYLTQRTLSVGNPTGTAEI